MFTCAFDNRYKLPPYFKDFISCVTQHTPLHLVTPARRLIGGASLIDYRSRHELLLVNPEYDISFKSCCNIFEAQYLHLSTNPSKFEIPCFTRWFAFNSITSSLTGDEYICMLDTDVLLLDSPVSVFKHISNACGESKYHLISSFREIENASIVVPAIVILKKSTLHNFCRYLMLDYFSISNYRNLLSLYFDQVGTGMQGGISDMTALNSFSKTNNIVSFDLNVLEPLLVIDNFGDYIKSTGANSMLKFTCNNHKCTLYNGRVANPLLAIHFQGNAKKFMPLFSRALLALDSKLIRCEDIFSFADSLPPSIEPRFLRLIRTILYRLRILLRTGHVRI